MITAIEGCARIAHRLSVSEGWSVPETNADAIRELAMRGVLPADLADRLVAAMGFRSVLVHRYAEVDNARVIANLDRLADFETFVTRIGDWLPAE